MIKPYTYGVHGNQRLKNRNYSWMDGRVDGQMEGQKGWKERGREGGGKVGKRIRAGLLSCSVLFSAI
jgi:hypothetical protein